MRRTTVGVKLVAERCSIVLVGAWNRAILTPDFLAKAVLGGDREPVFELGVTPPFVLRVITKRAMALVLPDRIELTAVEASEEGVAMVFGAANDLLAQLEKTPVTAVGLNIGVQSDQFDPRLAEQLAGVAASLGGAAATVRMMVTSLLATGAVRNVVIDTSVAPSICEINTHIKIADGRASGAKAALAAIRPKDAVDEAMGYGKSVFGDVS